MQILFAFNLMLLVHGQNQGRSGHRRCQQQGPQPENINADLIKTLTQGSKEAAKQPEHRRNLAQEGVKFIHKGIQPLHTHTSADYCFHHHTINNAGMQGKNEKSQIFYIFRPQKHALLDLPQAGGDQAGAATPGCGAWIQDPKAVLLLAKGLVGVAEENCLYLGSPCIC